MVEMPSIAAYHYGGDNRFLNGTKKYLLGRPLSASLQGFVGFGTSSLYFDNACRHTNQLSMMDEIN